MTAGMQTWRFRALDTWFFRESRPMESIGGSELLSTFPPSPRTMAGAIRSLVGHKHEVVDWKRWRAKDESNKPESYFTLKQRLGGADNYGTLRFSGPWLAKEDKTGKVERLYPVPRNIVIKHCKTDDQKVEQVGRMTLGVPRYCDLGEKVRLPVLPDQDQGWQFAENYWIPETALRAILAGGICQPGDFVSTADLFERETRLGIARNNLSRSVTEGMLYQTCHIRPKPAVFIETDVSGLLADDYDTKGVLRLGGEGRGADYSVCDMTQEARPSMPLWGGQSGKGIILYLLTPAALTVADTEADKCMPLPGFSAANQKGMSVWTGELNGVALTLHSAVQGMPVREGGWDLANHCPRAVTSFAPAGSVYYLTVDDGNVETAAEALHLTQLPAGNNDLALGRGLVAAGLWPVDEWIKE